MNILQNLCPHESILLILGIIMFSALIFSLVWSVVKEKKIGVLFPFFIIPVLMIGYPTVGSFQYQEGKLEFKTLLAEYMEGSMNEDEAEEFMEVYKTLSESCKSGSDPDALNSFARAQLETGNYEQASEIAERAVALQPNNSIAREIQAKSKEQIQKREELNIKTTQLNRIMETMESGDMERERGIEQMNDILTDLEIPENIDGKSASVLAKALAYTGEKESALIMIDKVLETPKISNQEAMEVRETRAAIEAGQFSSPNLQPGASEEIQLNVQPALNPQILNQQNLKARISLGELNDN